MHRGLLFPLLLALSFLVGGTVKGVTGMGLPTVAMGLLGTIMTPAAAAAMLIIPSVVTNAWQMLAGPSIMVVLRRLWLMMSGIVLGTTGAASLLTRVDPKWSGLALGVVLMLYAAYALISPMLSVSARLARWLSPMVGVVTGIVTGATGVFVMPAAPYLEALRLDKEELVQALGLSFTVSTIALAVGLSARRTFRVDQLALSTIALIPALTGMYIGQKIRIRMNPRRFRQVFLCFLLALGLGLAFRALL